MKKFLIIIINLTLVIGLAGCAKKASKPSDVLNLLKDVKTEEEARSYFTKGTLKAMDEFKKIMPDAKEKKGIQSIDKTDKWEVMKEEVQGDTATVTYKYTNSSNQKKVGTVETIKLKKEDGSWKIDLEAEMNAGLQMMKAMKGLDVNKIMKDAMKNIK